MVGHKGTSRSPTGRPKQEDSEGLPIEVCVDQILDIAEDGLSTVTVEKAKPGGTVMTFSSNFEST